MSEQSFVPESVNRPTSTPPSPREQKKTGTAYFLWEVVKFAGIALIVVAPVRIFIASPFIVSGASMEPAFDSGHYLIIDQITYRFHPPERGDVIVFRYPNDPSKFFIKRIIGLPSETVNINNGSVSIVSGEFPGGILLSEPYIVFPKNGEVISATLSDNEYYVLGDNRANSSDSRVWGTLPGEYITGRALVRLFPLTRIGIFPGVIRY